MALFKLKSAKDEFLLKALADGRLILNQRFPQKCSPRMPLAMLHNLILFLLPVLSLFPVPSLSVFPFLQRFRRFRSQDPKPL